MILNAQHSAYSIAKWSQCKPVRHISVINILNDQILARNMQNICL